MTKTKVKNLETSLTITDPRSKDMILSHRIIELENENNKLKQVVSLYEEEEKQRQRVVPTEEIICIEEIDTLRNKQKEQGLELNDVKMLDILIRNLYALRGTKLQQNNKNSKNINEVDELLKIVEADYEPK